MEESHKDPESCLTTMSFQYSDGGRTQYIEELEQRELPTGDGAVVAMVHAINDSPTARSSTEAIWALQARWFVLKRWKGRIRGESTLVLLKRKLAGWLSPRAAYTNPIHKTLTPVYDQLLEGYGYIRVFEGDSGPELLCICDPKRAYIVEGFTDTGGGHVTAVWNHTVLGGYDASKRPFGITNIWVLPPASSGLSICPRHHRW